MNFFKLFFLSIPIIILAQTADTIQPKKQLPFAIDESKKMPDFELEDKKEGTFITGVPRFEFDPIRGFGVGGNVNFFVNKTKEDPFFDYTPYRHLVNAQFFIYENGRFMTALNYDAPYIFDSKWRLRADFVVWQDPEAQYWGIGSQTLNHLQFRDQRTGQVRQFNKLKDYEDNLNIATLNNGSYLSNTFYNNMLQEEILLNLLLERTMLDGKLRLMFGYEALFTRFNFMSNRIIEDAVTLDGQTVEATSRETKVEKEIADGVWNRFNLAGFNNDNNYQFTSMLAGAIMYDTRDFEPDPSKGLYFEYSHEYSATWLGSDFSFSKFMLQSKVYHTFTRWKNNKNRLTFAGSASFGHIFGSKINFIEMWDLSSQSEAGGIMVLGGERSLRGYREARFLAPTVGLVNLEMRSRFYDFKMFNQHFILGANVFYDFGTVWDSPSQMTFKNWRGAPGLGARINWNQSTVIRFDFAQSREGSQMFFGFGQVF